MEKDKSNTVKTVLTYIRNGPISGLPYDKLISSVQQYSNNPDLKFLLKDIINNIDLNLLAIEIHHGKLKRIKNIVNTLAYCYLTNKSYLPQNSYELLYYLNSEVPWYKHTLELQSMLSSLIICHKNLYFTKDISNFISIDLVTKEMLNNEAIDMFLPIYYKLSFAKNNYWIHVLSNKTLNDKINFNINTKLEPYILVPKGVKNIIQSMNPSLHSKEIDLILKELYSYKNWLM